MFHKPLVVLLFLFSGFLLKSQQVPCYPIKSGIIEYTLTGGYTGTETISFDKYGKLIHISKTVSFIVDGEILSENLILIIKNDSLFEYNTEQKTYAIYPVSATSYHASNHLVNHELLNVMGFSPSGKEIVAEYECEKYVSSDGVLWVWKGIVLRSNLSLMGVEVCTKAIRFRRDVNIPSSKFNNPKGNYLQINK